jgi:hypothetical protein
LIVEFSPEVIGGIVLEEFLSTDCFVVGTGVGLGMGLGMGVGVDVDAGVGSGVGLAVGTTT